MPGAEFSNIEEFSDADGMAFVQNPRGLCCKSPTKSCQRFYAMSFSTMGTSLPWDLPCYMA